MEMPTITQELWRPGKGATKRGREEEMVGSRKGQREAAGIETAWLWGGKGQVTAPLTGQFLRLFMFSKRHFSFPPRKMGPTPEASWAKS